MLMRLHTSFHVIFCILLFLELLIHLLCDAQNWILLFFDQFLDALGLRYILAFLFQCFSALRLLSFSPSETWVWLILRNFGAWVYDLFKYLKHYTLKSLYWVLFIIILFARGWGHKTRGNKGRRKGIERGSAPFVGSFHEFQQKSEAGK